MEMSWTIQRKRLCYCWGGFCCQKAHIFVDYSMCKQMTELKSQPPVFNSSRKHFVVLLPWVLSNDKKIAHFCLVKFSQNPWQLDRNQARQSCLTWFALHSSCRYCLEESMYREYFLLIDSSLCHQEVSNHYPLSQHVRKNIKVLFCVSFSVQIQKNSEKQ